MAAARAASVWARTRRSTWTNAPLAIPRPASVVVTAPLSVPVPIAAAPHVTTLPKSAAPAAPIPQQPSLAERIADVGRTFTPSAAKWLIRAAGVAALGGAAYVGLPYLSKALQTRPTRTTTTGSKKDAKPSAPA